MIDVASAKHRSVELGECAEDLRDARKDLMKYQSRLQNGWLARETTYYVQVINELENRLFCAENELIEIAQLMRSTAEQIRAEEEEAARRAAEEEAARRAAEEEAARRAAEEEAARRAVEEAAKRAVKEAAAALTSALKYLK